MSFQSTVTFSMTCLVALAMPLTAVNAQDGAAVPGIQPAVVATEKSDEELMKTASLLLFYRQVAQMKMQLKGDGFELDPEAALEGARRALAGEEVGIPMEEITSVMGQMREKMQAQQNKMMDEMKQLAATNKTEGTAYLTENAKKPGVQTLDAGVQYQVMVEGTGPTPNPTDKVKINYHGTFIDGRVFDSTLEPPRGGPAKPAVGSASGFVDGFNAALQAMPVGSKWKISIPAEQAYGMRGRGPIGPNKTLIFEIEMLEILPPVVAPGDVVPPEGQ